MGLKISKYSKMLLHLDKKIFLLLLLFNNFVLCGQKPIKKITADLTEFDRIKNNIKFYGNVKVEIDNGYVLCNKAEYVEKEEKVFFDSNVYFVGISTKDNLKIDIKAQFGFWDAKNKILKFEKDVVAMCKSLYNNGDLMKEVTITSNILLFDYFNQTISCKDNVEIFSQDTKILCSTAKYFYNEGTIFINDEETTDKMRFLSLKENLKLKSCESKKAVLNLKESKIILSGSIEAIFYQ